MPTTAPTWRPAAIFGANLAAQTTPAASMPLPTALGGTSVEITAGGQTVQAPLVGVSPGQVNAQVPFSVPAGTAQVVVVTAAGRSNPASITIQTVAPSLLTTTQDGKGRALVAHGDYSLVTDGAPAKEGEVVMLFLAGLGAVAPTIRRAVPRATAPILGLLTW